MDEDTLVEYDCVRYPYFAESGYEKYKIDCNQYESFDPEHDYVCKSVECETYWEEKWDSPPDCAYCAATERVCKLKSAVITPECSMGESEYCEEGEKISFSVEFDNDCEITDTVYLQINATSLDGECTCGYTGNFEGIVQKEPEIASPCYEGHTRYDDGTCRAEITPNQDGWTTGGHLNTDDNTIFVGYRHKTGPYPGFVTWNTENIPDDAVITASVFKYDVQSERDNGRYQLREMSDEYRWNCKFKKNEAGSVKGDAMDGKKYLDNSFTTKVGYGFELELNSDANLAIREGLDENCFKVGIAHDGNYDFDEHTKFRSSENRRSDGPTLIVNYTRFTGTASGEWEIPMVGEECDGKELFAYSAELWNGKPGEGTLIKKISDGITNADSSYPVEGSFIPTMPPEEELSYELNRGWNLISIPYKDSRIKNNGCTDSDFKLYTYDGVTEKWNVDTIGIENADGGKSYWIHSDSNCGFSIIASKGIDEEDILISEGWNYIGSPKDGLDEIGLLSDNCLDCVDGICDTLTTKWYNPVSKTWDDVTTLEKGKGYILKCED